MATKTRNDLTTEERALVRLRRDHDQAEEKYIKARSRFRESVAGYLDNGGSPTRLGKILGVTRGRVYQYRTSWYAERDESATG